MITPKEPLFPDGGKKTPAWQWIIPGVVFGGPVVVVVLALISEAANGSLGLSPAAILLYLGIGGVLLFIALVVLIVRALIRVGDKRPAPIVVNQGPQLPPPGWYPDAQGQLRWFDGQEWTDFRKPPEA